MKTKSFIRFLIFRKLRKEEKEYKTYFMTGSISSRNHSHSHPHQRHYHSDLCRRTSEHYRVRITKTLRFIMHS